MKPLRVIVVGGGASGIFAAIACAEENVRAEVVVLEKGKEFLAKVRLSGGGRCNVTHSCFDARTLSGYYPRGGKSLIGAFHQFQPEDTVAWFAARGIALKTESDGRMFPASDSSATIVNGLLHAARTAGVQLFAQRGVRQVERTRTDGFIVTLDSGEHLRCDRVLLASGGCRSPDMEAIIRVLGHAVEPPVPSLFSFRLEAPWDEGLAGLSLQDVGLSVPGTTLKERGALLFTHTGISGPAALRLSAWGARCLHEKDYRFPLLIHWLPTMRTEDIAAECARSRQAHGARHIANHAVASLPSRLWERLISACGLSPALRWAALSGEAQGRLAQQIAQTSVQVRGKSPNKEEFVTCGGVRLSEVLFKTMSSRLCPGLYFAGEILDVDGLTGGFNFQAAWTTGWIAGKAMAAPLTSTAPAHSATSG